MPASACEIVGASVAETFVATYRMEQACAMQLAFQQSMFRNVLADARYPDDITRCVSNY